jgi:hypothetical protein
MRPPSRCSPRSGRPVTFDSTSPYGDGAASRAGVNAAPGAYRPGRPPTSQSPLPHADRTSRPGNFERHGQQPRGWRTRPVAAHPEQGTPGGARKVWPHGVAGLPTSASWCCRTANFLEAGTLAPAGKPSRRCRREGTWRCSPTSAATCCRRRTATIRVSRQTRICGR